MNGTSALVLHAHIPYCRKAGTWPAGEEWLFEALEETYIPLLRVMRQWKLDGVPARLTIGVVPTLAEQLADDYMRRRFGEYMEDRIRRAEGDIRRFADDPARRAVAEYWRDRCRRNYDAYRFDFYADVLGTLRWLQDEGVCEVIASAATHGLLPLLESEAAIFAQVRVGVETYRRHFGRDPHGFWLPECAYRPADGRRRGVDGWLADAGMRYFVVETHGLTGAAFVDNRHGEAAPVTDRGYRLESGVAVYGRNAATGQQVWSPGVGYPADPSYLEFHRKDGESGLRYWRVTDRKAGEKALYDPWAARERVESHAGHFVWLLREEVARAASQGIETPIVVSPYDAELFGHWWHEGVDWLDAVGRRLAADREVKSETLGAFTERQSGEFETVRMSPSTWGLNGDFTTWQSAEHAWVWPIINSSVSELGRVLRELSARDEPRDDRGRRILRQLSREVLLMQGSDWPFLLFTGQAKEYANARFHQHHQRFLKLLWAARNLGDRGRLSDADLAAVEELDNPWPELDYSLWLPR